MNHCLPQCAEKVKSTLLSKQSEHCETVVFCPQCKQIVCINCMICHFLNVRHEGLINYLELDNYTTTFLPKLDILVQEINTLYERTRRKTATDPKKEEEFTKDLTSFNTNINLCITEMMKLKETINLYMNYMISLCRTREVKTKNFSHIIEEEDYAILKKDVYDLAQVFESNDYEIVELFGKLSSIKNKIEDYKRKSLNMELPHIDYFNPYKIDPQEIDKYQLIKKELNISGILEQLKLWTKGLEEQKLPKLNEEELEKTPTSIVKEENKMDIVPPINSNIPPLESKSQEHSLSELIKQEQAKSPEKNTPKFNYEIKGEAVLSPGKRGRKKKIVNSPEEFSFGSDAEESQQEGKTTRKRNTRNISKPKKQNVSSPGNKGKRKVTSNVTSPSSNEKAKRGKARINSVQDNSDDNAKANGKKRGVISNAGSPVSKAKKPIKGVMLRSDPSQGSDNSAVKSPPKTKAAKKGKNDIMDAFLSQSHSSSVDSYPFVTENLISLKGETVRIYNAKANVILETKITPENCEDIGVYADITSISLQKYVNTENSLIITGGQEKSIQSSRKTFQLNVNPKVIDELLKYTGRPNVNTRSLRSLIYISKKESMKIPRECHNIVFLKDYDKVIVAGGKSTKLVECIQLASNYWTEMRPLNLIRCNATMFVFNGNLVYIVGGYNMESSQYQEGYEMLNIDYPSQGWRLIEIQSGVLSICTMGVVYKDQDTIILLGGFKGGKKYLSDKMEITFNGNGAIQNINKTANAIMKSEKGVLFYSSYAFFKCGERFFNWEFKSHHSGLIEYDEKNKVFTYPEDIQTRLV